MRCSFCKYDNLKSVYKPVETKVSMVIVVCQNCGLVQSESDKAKALEIGVLNDEELVIKRLSCDADYSEIRVGKAQMVDSAIKIIDANIPRSEINEMLDMCSARGHFVRKALEHFNLDSIDCMDPDKYMTLSYCNDSRINLTVGKYDSLNTDKLYDLIYSCHTLEHYREPDKNINFMVDHVRPNGYMLVNVPNILTVADGRNLDEFFYDYHKFYFNREILTDYIVSLGMELVDQDDSNYTIELLFKKCGKRANFKVNDLYAGKNEALIAMYIENLKQNRRKLPSVADKIHSMASGKRNAILGCGRALDALVTYGNLKIDYFDFLIDNFLINATKEFYGKKLHRSLILDAEKVDNLFLITRSSSGNLALELSRKYPEIKITHINDILDSVV